jgi:metal-responsive CopG/Arc/MetJ family transcriptional regulator
MYNRSMRTTVEMKPEHRSALLSVASRRGQKGFSAVLGEAIEHYLRAEQDREKRRKSLLSLAGSLSAHEAVKLRRTIQDLREHWR